MDIGKLILCLSIVSMYILTSCHQKQTVGKWDYFEITLQNQKEYLDPIRDVSLDAVFINPDGERLNFWGFYDSLHQWKVRFMPNQVGTWKYIISFPDGNIKSIGEFICVDSDIPGLINRDAQNPLWFGFEGGQHFFMRSFHAGDRFFAYNWDDPNSENDGKKRTEFLDWFQGQGYNTLSVASHFQKRNEEGRGKSWDIPELWPINPNEFKRLEGILDQLKDRGVILYPFAGFFGQSSEWPSTQKEQELYIRYLIARLGPYWNLLFNVAGPEPLIKAKEFGYQMTIDDINRLGDYINKNDPFGHLVSVHNQTTNEQYQLDLFKNEFWYEYSTLQGPKTINLKKLSDQLIANHHWEKPLYAQETLWSNNKYHPQYSDKQLRKNAYVITMTASSFNFADNQGNSSTGFSGTLDPTLCSVERHHIIKKVWDFFETIPYYEMSPYPKLVDQGFCLAVPEKRYLVYVDSIGSLNLKIMQGDYSAKWINAQDVSEQIKIQGIDSGITLFTPDHGEDWLLYVIKNN